MAATASHRVEQSNACECHTRSSRRPMPCRDWVSNQSRQNQGKNDPGYAEQMPCKAKNEARKVAGQDTFATRKQRTNLSPLTQQ
jgi:hypothetical protein